LLSGGANQKLQLGIRRHLHGPGDGGAIRTGCAAISEPKRWGCQTTCASAGPIHPDIDDIHPLGYLATGGFDVISGILAICSQRVRCCCGKRKAGCGVASAIVKRPAQASLFGFPWHLDSFLHVSRAKLLVAERLRAATLIKA